MVESRVPEAETEPPPDTDTGGGTTNTGGGTTSTGGSSGGSSAPAEPKDPYDAWYSKLGRDDQDTVAQLRAKYVALWGVGPPLAVLQAAIAQGLNVWEFEEAQKRNPAWWKTDAAEDMTFPAKLMLYQMGLIPKPKKRGGKGGGKGGGKDDDFRNPPGGGDPGPIIKPDKDKGRPGYLGPPDREKDEGREIGVIRG